MDEQSAQTASEETPVEQPQESQDSTQVEDNHESDVTNESAETPTETPESAPKAKEEVVEEEPEWKPEPFKAPTLAAPDVRQFVDAEGNLDLGRYNQAQQEWSTNALQAATQAAMQVVSQSNAYQREWSKAEDKYPELKSNKQLKDMVQAIHANSAQPGFKYLSPAKAADQLFAIRGEAKSEGMKAAKESRTVQAAAGLGNSNPPATTQSDNRAALKAKMKTGSKVERAEATREYLKLIL